MGLPLTIQESDNELILKIKDKMKANSKIEVVRFGLKLLESNLEQAEKYAQWAKACEVVKKESARINKEFQKNSRLKKIK